MGDLLSRARAILGAANVPVDTEADKKLPWTQQLIKPFSWYREATDAIAKEAGPDPHLELGPDHTPAAAGTLGRDVWGFYKESQGLTPEVEQSAMRKLQGSESLMAKAARVLSSFGNRVGEGAAGALLDPTSYMRLGPAGALFAPEMASQVGTGLGNASAATTPEGVGEGLADAAVPAALLGMSAPGMARGIKAMHETSVNIGRPPLEQPKGIPSGPTIDLEKGAGDVYTPRPEGMGPRETIFGLDGATRLTGDPVRAATSLMDFSPEERWQFFGVTPEKWTEMVQQARAVTLPNSPRPQGFQPIQVDPEGLQPPPDAPPTEVHDMAEMIPTMPEHGINADETLDQAQIRMHEEDFFDELDRNNLAKGRYNQDYDIDKKPMRDAEGAIAEEMAGGEAPAWAHMQTEKGIKAGLSRQNARATLSNQGPPTQGAIRELVQNAVDAVRSIAGKGAKVHVEGRFDEKDSRHHDLKAGHLPYIKVTDNGIGMSPEVFQKEYFDIAGSFGKGEGSAGRFGIGKAAYLGPGVHVVATTTWRDPKTKKVIQSSTNDSLDKLWNDEEEGLNFESKEVPPDTPTGTTIQVMFPKGLMQPWQGQTYLGNTIGHSRLPGVDVTGVVNGAFLGRKGSMEKYFNDPQNKTGLHKYKYTYGAEDTWLSNHPIGESDWSDPTELPMPGGDKAEIVWSGDSGETFFGLPVHILNNGLYQFTASISVPDGLSLPTELAVDLHPSGATNSPSYPFKLDRDGLKDEAQGAIGRFIKEKLVNEGIRKRNAQLMAALFEAPEMPNGMRVVDPDGRPEARPFLESMAAHPAVQEFANEMTGLFGPLRDAILEFRPGTGQKTIREMEAIKRGSNETPKSAQPAMDSLLGSTFHGILASAPSLHGINVMTSKIGKEKTDTSGPPSHAILINPFGLLEWSQQFVTLGSITQEQVPQFWADAVVDALAHEIVHSASPLTGHDEQFAAIITRMRGILNAARYDPYMVAAAKLAPLYEGLNAARNSIYEPYQKVPSAKNLFKGISDEMAVPTNASPGQGAAGGGGGATAGGGGGVQPPAAVPPGGGGPPQGMAPAPPAGAPATQAAGGSLGNLARAGVAGRAAVVLRNLGSGIRMLGEDALFTNPLAYVAADRLMADASSPNEKKHFARKARFYKQIMAAYPGAAWNSLLTTGVHTLAEIGMKPNTQGHTRMQRRKSMIKAVEGMGLPEMSQRLEGLSNPDVQAKTKLEKALMIFNILADQFFITSVVDSRLRALEHEFGVSTPADLIRVSRSRKDGPFIREMMANAGTDALRIAWNLRGVTGGMAHSLAKMPVVNNVLVSPFTNALFANMIPGVAESFPLLNRLSKRYQISMQHEQLRVELGKQRDVLAAAKRAHKAGKGSLDDAVAAAKSVSATHRKMKALKKEGIFSPETLYARSLKGIFVIAAAAALRVARGDDGTEYDELPAGQGKVAKVTPHMGEDAPYVLIGDVVGHKIIASQEGRPSKYDADDAHLPAWPAQVVDAALTNRYGQDPGWNLISEFMSGSMMSKQFVEDSAARVLSNLGAMGTTLAWPGDIGRGADGLVNPEAGLARSTKPGPDENFLTNAANGAMSNVPGARDLLPPSPDWLAGKERPRTDTVYTPFEGEGVGGRTPGANVKERGELETFLLQHQGRISYSQVSPRMTGDRIYDGLVLKNFKALLDDYILPDLPEVKGWDDELQVEWLRSRMQEARQEAQKEALQDYQDVTGGDVPTKIARKALEDDRTRELQQDMGKSGMPRTRVPKQSLLPPPQ